MHILHVTPYYRPAYAFGGVVRAVEGMATTLVSQGHQVTVLTTDALDQQTRIPSSTEEVIDGVRVIRRPNISTLLRGKLNLSTPRSMRQTAQTLMPDVDLVHIHEFRTVENLLVTPVAFEQDIPIVLSPHGTINLSTGRSRLKVWWDKLLSAGVALRIDHVIALVQPELDDIQTLWDTFGRRQIPTTFSIIPNGIHLEDFSHLPDPTDFRKSYNLGSAPTVLFMGRLQARKGVDVLVNAFKIANVENSRLLIVGPDEGMLATIRDLAGDDKRIVIAGYLDGDDRLKALSASDLFALPAIGEGLSMAMLEAMGAGLPVILSAGCNLDPQNGGYVVDVDPSAIAEKLRVLLTDDTQRAQMGQSARELVQARYTWDQVAWQLDEIYTEIYWRHRRKDFHHRDTEITEEKESLEIVTNTEVIAKIRDIINCLVVGDYERLVNQGYLGEYDTPDNIEVIRETIESYLGTITMPPDNIFETLEKLEFPTEDGDRETYFVEPDLWYDDEASDLWCKFICNIKLDGSVHVRLYGILA